MRVTFIGFLLLLMLPSMSVRASEPDSVGAKPFDPNGRVIDSIIIDNRNIYDDNATGFEGIVFRTANRLHRITRPHVVKRELLFSEGDVFDNEIAEETARNLRTRLPFNNAWIKTDTTTDGRLIVTVVTQDQWSLLGTFRVSRDGNETDYQFGLEERNFLGNNQSISLDYFIEEEDGEYLRWQLINPRIGGYPIRVSTAYNDDPTNETRRLTLERPYYDLGQQISLLFTMAEKRGRRDQYLDGTKVATWQSGSDAASVGADLRWGSYYQKVGLGLRYDYLFERTSSREILVSDDSFSTVFPTDSIYHQFSLSARMTDLDFIVAKRINGFYYTEDITLERSIGISFARAFKSGFDGHHYDRFGMSSSLGRRYGAYIFSLAYDWSIWFAGDKNIRRSVVLSGKVHNNGLEFLTTVFRAVYRSDWRDNGSAGLSLGGKSGLRGFGSNHITGDRSLLLNIEGRFYSGLELLSVLLGGVAFLDVGQTWGPGKPMVIRDFEHSVGVGVRLSMERFSKTEMVRIDLALAQDNSWTLSFGSGQYF